MVSSKIAGIIQSSSQDKSILKNNIQLFIVFYNILFAILMPEIQNPDQ
jgi:hypothetical protein